MLNATANLRMNALINAGMKREEAFEQYRAKLRVGTEEAPNEPEPPAELYTVEWLRESLQTPSADRQTPAKATGNSGFLRFGAIVSPNSGLIPGCDGVHRS